VYLMAEVKIGIVKMRVLMRLNTASLHISIRWPDELTSDSSEYSHVNDPLTHFWRFVAQSRRLTAHTIVASFHVNAHVYRPKNDKYECRRR
jgi:hypothetical protein